MGTNLTSEQQKRTQNEKDKTSNLLNYKYKENVTDSISSNIEKFTFHSVKTANILIVGPTGSGKSTFLNVMKNPNYISEYELDSQTQDAQMEQNLFEIDNEFFMVQVIDTPGFGDSSSDSKSDFELEEMILKFIKQGVTELHMVLITVRYGIRFEKSQVDTIMNVLRFLGKDMRANTSVLCTFAENTTEQDRLEWIRKAKNSNVKPLLQYCRNKVFFTGMLQKGSEMQKQVFTRELRVDQTKIITAAIRAKAISLSGEDHEAISNQFKVYESAAKDSLTLKKLLPIIPRLASDLDILKTKLSHHQTNEKAIAVIEKYAQINQVNIVQQVTEWSKLQTAVADYIQKGGTVQSNAKTVRQQYNLLQKAVEELKKTLDNIELFDDDCDDEEVD